MSPDGGRWWRAVRGGDVGALQRPLASGLTLAGAAFVLLGVGRLLLLTGVLPELVGEVVATWWPAALIALGGWSLQAGRRVTGTSLVVVGAGLLVLRVVPEGYRLPVLLVGVGLLLLWGSVGGRRWLLGGLGVSLVDELRGAEPGTAPGRSHVALFDSVRGRLVADAAATGPVECLALFGDVLLDVPRDLDVVLVQTAVFGDVRAPDPPPGPDPDPGQVVSTVTVHATAVFGDVEFRRE